MTCFLAEPRNTQSDAAEGERNEAFWCFHVKFSAALFWFDLWFTLCYLTYFFFIFFSYFAFAQFSHSLAILRRAHSDQDRNAA